MKQIVATREQLEDVMARREAVQVVSPDGEKLGLLLDFVPQEVFESALASKKRVASTPSAGPRRSLSAAIEALDDEHPQRESGA